MTDLNSNQPKRSRGRPAKGKPILVRIDDNERITAELLGDGVVAEGIRNALIGARLIGEERFRQIIAELKDKE